MGDRHGAAVGSCCPYCSQKRLGACVKEATLVALIPHSCRWQAGGAKSSACASAEAEKAIDPSTRSESETSTEILTRTSEIENA